MYPSIKFTFENPEIIYEKEKKVQVLNFLDVKITWHKDNSVETDIYYKPTNTHDYLSYDSAHPDHTKNNISYNLGTKIIVFVSNSEKAIIRLDELKECKYAEHVISKSIFNTKLQGPAPNLERIRNVIPFVTTYYPNINNKSLMQTVKNKFKNYKEWTPLINI